MKVENLTIKKVGELKTGVSQATGNKWAIRSILLTWEDETGESYMCAIVDDDVWKSLGYSEGDTATLNLRFRTKPHMSGYVSNDIRVFIPQNQ